MKYPKSVQHFVYKCMDYDKCTHGCKIVRKLLEQALLFVLFLSCYTTTEAAGCRIGRHGDKEYELNATFEFQIP